MKEFLLLCLFVACNTLLFSQGSFEKGYYIDTLNKRVDCFIQNKDWKDNPFNFKYKLTEDAKTKLATIVDVKEFSVEKEFKYVRGTVLIDRSSDAVDNYSNNPNPEYVKESQFFRVLVEGKATLYLYEDSEIKRFLYRYGTSEIEQLVYKAYVIPVNKIVKNYGFRKQILDNLISGNPVCPNVTIRQVQKIDYEKESLMDFFKKYNECQNTEFISFDDKNKRDLFNLNIRPGLSYGSMVFYSNGSIRDIETIDFGNKSTYRFGVEAEFFLPYNKNKWSILIEPNYHYFKSRRDVSDLGISGIAYFEIDYKSLEMPLGLRYYILLSENSRFFVNASISGDFSKGTVFNFGNSFGVDIRTRVDTSYGLGFRFKRLIMEARYQKKRLTDLDIPWHLDNEKLSVIISYSLF